MDLEETSSLASENEELEDCSSKDCSTETETFHLNTRETPLDIVFVLDVSRSMRYHLKKLGQSMNSLLRHIQNFDWQMAFTTADHGDHTKIGGRVGEEDWRDYQGNLPYFGKFMPLEYQGQLAREYILQKTTPLHEVIFHDTLTLNNNRGRNCNKGLPPFCQGGHEQPLRALKSAFERKENKDFFNREGSIVIAFVVTNEDERVEDPDNATTAQEVVETFHSKFTDKSFYGFGIIVQDSSCYKTNDRRSTRSEYSNKVGELAKITRGRNISICESDYGQALAGISHLIQERALDSIQLKKLPQKIIDVSIQPQQNTQWTHNGRFVIFEPALQPGTSVTVQYE